MDKHTVTVIAAAVFSIVALLGWYALIAYVVTATGSTSGLADVSTATARFIWAVVGAASA